LALQNEELRKRVEALENENWELKKKLQGEKEVKVEIKEEIKEEVQDEVKEEIFEEKKR